MGVTWVKGGFRDSQQIKNCTINFKGKSWWILAQHRLCPTTGDDVLSLVWAAMLVDFTTGYAFDFGEFLDREMRDIVFGD